MTKTNPTKLSLVEPTGPLLNNVVEEIKSEEITSLEVQGIIDRMLELAAGKGHSKEDSRQMVGLAAPQLGASKRIVTIDITADGSKKSSISKFS